VDETTGQLTLVVEITVRPGAQAEARRAVAELAEATRRLDRGLVRFEVGIDPADDTRILGYEVWQSPAALDEHARQPHTRRFKELAAGFAADPDRPLSVHRWQPLQPELPAPYPAAPAAAAPPPPGFAHGWHTSAGARLHFVRGGTGDPLVLVHGFPQTWYAWREVMARLADRYTVVAVDLRGLGDSEAGPVPTDVPTGAADLAALATALDLGPVFVAGQDWGGSTAFAFAAARPDLVRRLAVLEAMPSGPWSAPGGGRTAWFAEFHRIAGLPETLTAGREADYLGWFYEAFTATPGVPGPDAIAEYLRAYRRPGAMASAFARYRGTDREVAHNADHLAGTLDTPVLALGGEHVFGDAVAANLRLAAAHVESAVLPGVGHFLSEEAPGPVADALSAFFGADPR
jgi:pimeloyl-ACP methyl ester carboxylesterase/quinol monooxygenase YgiN